MAARPVAEARSEPGPVPLSPKNISSAAIPPSAMASIASSSDRVWVNRSSMSECAKRPSDARRLMIDRTSRRRLFPSMYAAVAWPASCVATARRSASV